MYDVKALVAFADTLRQMPLELNAVVCPLAQKLALLPITDELARNLEAQGIGAEESPRVRDIPAGVVSLASRLSRDGAVAYVSAAYFGGAGGQIAIVWRDGKIVFEAEDRASSSGWPDSPISQALRFMGVKANNGQDEFDTVELGNHRSTEKWAETYARAKR